MSDVDFFISALNRLKEGLGVSKDKEVAAALGMEAKALNARKARHSFPEKELLALSARRPELELDVGYILGGSRTASKTDPGQAGVLAMQNLQACTEAINRVSSSLSYEPPTVWTGLVLELMFSHGLREAGARRIIETLKSERNTP